MSLTAQTRMIVTIAAFAAFGCFSLCAARTTGQDNLRLEPNEIENLRIAWFSRSPDVGRGVTFDVRDGVNFKANSATLRDLIRFAFESLNAFPGSELLESQIQGNPEWLSTRYDIRFRVDGPSIRDMASFTAHAKLMLRVLLTDRFKLKTHSEVRTVSGFILSVAPSGPKLPQAGEWNSPTWMPPPEPFGAHNFACATHEDNGVQYLGILSTGMPISRMVTCLANHLQVRVIDESALTGSYSFKVLGVISKVSPAESRFPTIYSVLQDQLGLVLQAKEVPTEFIIVDRAEIP